MRPQEIIRKKRDGEALTHKEINAFVTGVGSGKWADYQISALLMACFLRGLSTDETRFLTEEMLHSGEVLDFSDIDAPKADKHSTGGVGDKTSLIIAPLAAVCGIAVPMISGRGLGHTGGTLDKLESITGYNVNLSLAEFKKVIKKCGFAMIGQTAEIAPADKKIYALRDTTATVEYIPLIVASIMSKKLAEGLDALVLDVKTGNGAFIKGREDSKKLAQALCKTGNDFNVRTEAVVSDMNEPLGKFAGNTLEVFECVKILRDEADAEMFPTRELSIELAARILVLTGITESLETARALCERKLGDGSALEKFRENILLQGGDGRVCDKPATLLDSNLQAIQIKSTGEGFVAEINTNAIGSAIWAIAGRVKVDDKIDLAIGYECRKKTGDAVKVDETLGVLFCRNENQASLIGKKLRAAYKIVEKKPSQEYALIKEVIN